MLARGHPQTLTAGNVADSKLLGVHWLLHVRFLQQMDPVHKMILFKAHSLFITSDASALIRQRKICTNDQQLRSKHPRSMWSNGEKQRCAPARLAC